jgi:2-keto-4-pentenoate hydratase/2-oxohepta-3-ene-1,7-dioic acid hydratase in catechol pathway
VDLHRGVTAANDVSARDVQIDGLPSGDYATAKSFPSFKPLGPGLIIGDEARQTLSIRTTVNGDLRQDADTDDLQEISWPPATTFVDAYKENLMAADTCL